MADNTAVQVDDPAADATFDHQDLVEKCTDFLKNGDSYEIYAEKIEQMVETGIYRLLVDVNDLRVFNTDLANGLMTDPVSVITAFEESVRNVTLADHTDPKLRKDNVVFHVGFVGSFGSHQVSPRGLLSRFLGMMVCVEGIVTKMSIIRPKMVKSVQYDPANNKHHIRHFRDATSLNGLPTKANVLTDKTSDGYALETDFGHCVFKNFQTVVIQEMPERAPLGQLPRSVDVLLDYDLVDSCKPGDRVQIVGVFRAFGQGTVGFRGKLIANSVQTIGKEVQGLVMTAKDLHNIRTEARRPDIFQRLSQSLAPSIYGHQYIKMALLLLLLGGVEKNLANGTHLRGDINILMVGDPSTAKSQLLRFVMGIAPLAVSSTGRSSTGVGLTAAVTTDPDTRERRLEAGAMVLADRGVVCIDEFDKMGPNDRVAIHEVMEQQTVTIAKAGIHATLNARCAVVAAANPRNGQYDRSQRPSRNVDLPDSLLSRFDLLFIVLDNINPDHDRAISEHILRLHRFQRPGLEGVPFTTPSEGAGASNDDDDEDREDMTSPVYQKFNPLLHGGFAAGSGRRDELYHPEFIRKYIHYAKNRMQPQLTDQACELISLEYANMRGEDNKMKTLSITARQLESFIRLSTAHAKARLSEVVEEVDVQEALKIVRFALDHFIHYQDEQNREREGAQDGNDSDDDDDDDDEDQNNNDDENNNNGNVWKKKKRITAPPPSKSKRPKLIDSDESEDDDDEDDDLLTFGGMNRRKTNNNAASNETGNNDENNAESESKPQGDEEEDSNDEEVVVDPQSDRFKGVVSLISSYFQRRRTEEMTIDDLVRAIEANRTENKDKSKPFSLKELDAILIQLEDDNKVMYRDGKIQKV